MTVQVTIIVFIGCFLVKIRIDHADVISDGADDTDGFTDADDSDANK